MSLKTFVGLVRQRPAHVAVAVADVFAQQRRHGGHHGPPSVDPIEDPKASAAAQQVAAHGHGEELRPGAAAQSAARDAFGGLKRNPILSQNSNAFL